MKKGRRTGEKRGPSVVYSCSPRQPGIKACRPACSRLVMIGQRSKKVVLLSSSSWISPCFLFACSFAQLFIHFHPLDLLFRALSFSPFLFFYPFRSCVPAGYLPVIPLLCLVALTIEHSISPISQPTNEQMKLLPFSSNRPLLNLNSCKRRDKNRPLKKQAAHQLTLLCKVSG